MVPRKKQFGEHVNNHQVEFVRNVAQRMGTIILVMEIAELEKVIAAYAQIASCIKQGLQSNNQVFNERIHEIVAEMLGKD